MSAKIEQDPLFTLPQTPLSQFSFDQEVAKVFDELMRRSVPGYESILEMIGSLAGEYARENSNCYDLGCSLGAATFSMRRNIKQKRVKIIAIDNAPAMIEKCRINLRRDNNETGVRIQCADIQEVEIKNASVVVLNFALQFVEPSLRKDLMARIYEGLNKGGILIISDRIAFDNELEEARQIELHHAFKKQSGYDELAIAQNWSTLENMLVADTLNTQYDRFQSIGFSQSLLWYQCFNFSSILAIK